MQPPVAQFLVETDAHLLTIAQTLVVVERAPEDRASLKALCKAIHAISERAHEYGFANVSNLAQAIEDALLVVHDHHRNLTPTLMNALFVALGGIEALVGMLKMHGAENHADDLLTPEMLDALKTLHATAAAVVQQPPGPPPAIMAGLTDRAVSALGLGLRTRNNRRVARQPVEIIYVLTGHQIFGVLMNQVYNILRPRATGVTFRVVEQPPPFGSALDGGIISYLNRDVPVIELSRRMGLPPVTPLAGARILITGTPMHPFGVAVDTIAGTQMAQVNDISALPQWLTRARLGGFVWGVIGVDPATLLATTQDEDARPTLSDERWDKRFHDVGIGGAAPALPIATGSMLQTESGPYHIENGLYADLPIETTTPTATLYNPPRIARRAEAPQSPKKLVLMLDLDALATQFLA